MRSKIRTYWVLALASATSMLPMLPSARAADLLDCYRSALGYDAQYQAALANVQAGREAYPQGLAGLLPTLTAQAVSQETNLFRQLQINEIPPEDRLYNTESYSVTLTQPLFRWAAWQNYRIGELQVAQAEAQFVQAQSDLMLRLAQAYFDVLLAGETLRVNQSQKVAAAEKLTSTRRNYEAGLATVVDFRDAKARYDVVSAAEIASANELSIKELALRQITGYASMEVGGLSPLRNWVSPGRLQPEQQTIWMDQAIAANPAVKAYEAVVAIAGRTIEVNRAGHFPTLDLSMSLNHLRESGSVSSATGSGNRYNQIGLTLSVPVFAGGGVSSKVRQSAHQYEEAMANLDRARRESAAKAAEAYLNYVNGLAQTEALEQAEQSAMLAVSASQRGVEVGVRTNLDVLDAEQQWFQTRRDLVKVRFDTLMAGLKLKAAAGSLGGSDLEKLNALLSAK